MKTIRNSFGSLAIIGGLIGSLNFIQAAGTIKPVQSVSADDMNVMLQAVEATTPVAAESVPKSGTFYSAQFPTWPPLPCNINNVPAWNIGDGVFLLSDLDVNYSQRPMASSMMAGGMRAMDVLSPGGGGDGGTNSYFTSNFVIPDYGTNLWIAQVGISSGSLVGVVTNSQADISYEIQSLTDLTQAGAGWGSEGFILGSELTNWTPMSVAQNGRTNLFLRIRSWADSTGSGIPDWWWLQYFGSVGGDPYGNPAGDGWNNLQKFQNGMDPNVFYTPPAPQGLTVSYNSVNGNTSVSWLPSPGPVTGYTVVRNDVWMGQTTNFNFSASVNNFPDIVSDSSDEKIDLGIGLDYGPVIDVQYQIQAHYGPNNSAWSSPVLLEPNYSSLYTSLDILQAVLPVYLIGGPQGSAYLAASALPSGTVALRVKRVDEYANIMLGDSSFDTYFDIPVSALTNGLYLLPTTLTTPGADFYGHTHYVWFVQTVDASNNPSEPMPLTYGNIYPEQNDGRYWIVPPYFDGRTQLKQNLIFLLRAATVTAPFYYEENSVVITNPANYAYSDFNNPYEFNGALRSGFDVFSPFQNNYVYRNFVFDPLYLDSDYLIGYLMTGVGGSYIYDGGLTLADPPTNNFQAPTINGATIPAVLATNDSQWLCSYPLDSSGNSRYMGEIGLFYNSNTNLQMASNVKNIYGLPFLSVNVSGTNVLYPENWTANDGYYYPETLQPQFQTVEYDFWNASPLPGKANFSTSQTSDLLITSVGNSIGVNGYAKLAVLNGYPGVYGYLGQYFDKAYKITNGIVTTNTTGVLSSYGQFFATQPGPAALVTMPAPDSGTCTVYCVSLQLDRSHDGNMDLSFSGPDATSQASPMECWVNSGHTEPGANGNLDMDLPVPPNSPNYSYGKITCQRDLENFFRLWVCGLPALPASQGYTVTLSMSPSSGNPAINLYASYDTNGSAA
jgi:hypothetical protein